ncbi:hypothetical protein NBRC3257_1552 [Gluconobacter thailandicus NBRC 3257]|uniref:Uncharacterized protein n=1 Tax=Gluconobacter thailandicus NBRC 3257 TaxID=1381097 RepID=A0ABQ0IYG6_GLUTH|nr:hypothetical protein [Gluconobacter thailandicus]AFW00527.1 hypothetical protein B932_0932 [Gluconobacter oxydans H24]GAC87884.1 hypothetical protein NBRC3255_1545 [Gluconobacter thailandicus NBRC 3255]GAD26553.1 hypothetical protein NBRC3257_1552 [Gluconobacter thailandicus NBRC 3257]
MVAEHQGDGQCAGMDAMFLGVWEGFGWQGWHKYAGGAKTRRILMV